MTAAAPKLAHPPIITWPLLPDDFILPDDPVDNDEHYPLAGALTQALATLGGSTRSAGGKTGRTARCKAKSSRSRALKSKKCPMGRR